MDENAAPQRRDRVIGFFAALDKAVQGHRLYEGKGDLVDRMFGDLKQTAASLLAEGKVTVRVTPAGLVFADKLLADGERKNPPYMFQLYCDGVREMTFFEGFTEDELHSLVNVLAEDYQATEETLVTRLWACELQHLRYYAVDSFTHTVDADLSTTAGFSGGSGRLSESESAAERVALSPDDLRILKADGAFQWVREAQAEGRANGDPAAEVVAKRFEAGTDYGRFVGIALRYASRQDGEEASPLLLSMYDSLINGRRADAVVALLQQVAESAAQEGPTQQAASALQKALLEPDRMGAMAPLFRDDHEAFDEVLRTLAALDGQLLVPLLLEVGPGPAQDALQDVLRESGIDLTDFYRSRLGDPDPEVVSEAITALGKVGSREAIEALCGALGSTLTKVRHAALEAMRGHYYEEARISLARILRDPSQENRLLALEILEQSGDTRVAGLLLSTIQDSQFTARCKEPEEQRSFLLALASFNDNRTVEFFEKALAEKNITRSDAVTAKQTLAAEALGTMKTDKARATLESFRGKWYHSKAVKEAVESALKG